MKNSNQLYNLIKEETKLTEAEFKSLATNNIVLRALNRYLVKKREAMLVPSKADYDCPSWSHKQADNIGYCRAINELLDLTE